MKEGDGWWLVNTEHIAGYELEPQFVFAKLVKLAAPHLEAYHGDLYHDALAVKKIVEDATERNAAIIVLFYGVRSTGTNLNENIDHFPFGHNPDQYRIELWRGAHSWEVRTYAWKEVPVDQTPEAVRGFT